MAFSISCISLNVCAEQAVKQDLKQELTDLVQSQPQYSQVAISAIDLSNNQLIYTRNADTLMLPASTQKLLTAVTAKLQLPTDFRFNTQLYAKGEIQAGKLNGDLYLSFNGDPTLTTENLNALLKQAYANGLTEVSGDLYLFKQADEKHQAVGWLWNDLGICFAAPVSRFIIDHNCIHGQFQPQKNSNKGQLNFPANLPVSLATNAYFDPSEQEEFCELELTRLPLNQFKISGCYLGTKAVKLAIALSDPEHYALQTVTRLITSSGIKLNGQITTTTQSIQDMTLLSQHRSAPLDTLLRTMLENSDNLIADSLFKAIGASYFDRDGSFTNGAAAMRQLLTAEGIDLEHAEIVDGSGLSRYNLLNANQLSQLLQLIYGDKRLNSLIDMLPVAGKTGTLRYKSPYSRAPLKEQVHAKTGTMQGVDNLAGFLTTKKQGHIAFVVLENGQSQKTKQEQAIPLHGRFLQQILTQADKGLR